MPVEPLMTWKKASNRWMKMYKGEWFTMSAKKLGFMGKIDSLHAANEWWKAKQAEIDGRMERQATLTADLAGQLAIQKAKLAIEKDHQNALDGDANLIALVPGYKEKLDSAFETAKNQLQPITVASGELTIGKQFNVWAELQLAAKKSAARKKMNLHMLSFFRDFMGEHVPLETVTEDKWEEYWHHLARKDYDDGYKGRIFAIAKNFLRWLSGKRRIILPANLDDGNLIFEEGLKAIKEIPLENVRKFFADATGQTRLHILLMLNCGFLGADIAELKQSEIDWKLGTITRKRSKTRKLKKEKAKKVPTVTYKLWPMTLKLLKEYNSKTDPVLLTVRGLPWIKSDIGDKVDSVYSNSNSIASNFKWLAKKSGVKIGTKDLRTAAATTLGQGPYKGYGEYFLGEVPSGTASKFYIPEDDAEFFKALTWLENKLAL